jgi:hypothetical protein
MRAAVWLGIWFGIANGPLDWANNADTWNSETGKDVWMDEFQKTHHIIWRLLLAYLLLTAIGLLAAMAGKALSLMFHHHNHFERMQVRLPLVLHASTCRLQRMPQIQAMLVHNGMLCVGKRTCATSPSHLSC